MTMEIRGPSMCVKFNATWQRDYRYYLNLKKINNQFVLTSIEVAIMMMMRLFVSWSEQMNLKMQSSHFVILHFCEPHRRHCEQKEEDRWSCQTSFRILNNKFIIHSVMSYAIQSFIKFYFLVLTSSQQTAHWFRILYNSTNCKNAASKIR